MANRSLNPHVAMGAAAVALILCAGIDDATSQNLAARTKDTITFERLAVDATPASRDALFDGDT